MPKISEDCKAQIRKRDKSVTHIDLSNRGLYDNDLIELQELLQDNPYITSLDLSFNNITEIGCKIIQLMSCIKKVNLSSCSLGDKGVECLIKTIIDDLNVSSNGLTDIGANLLLQNLEKYKVLSVNRNPRISSDLEQRLRCKFVEDEPVYPEPVGIDLGLCIHSNYPNGFLSIGAEAHPFFNTRSAEFQKMSATEEDQLLKEIGVNLGAQAHHR